MFRQWENCLLSASRAISELSTYGDGKVYGRFYEIQDPDFDPVTLNCQPIKTGTSVTCFLWGLMRSDVIVIRHCKLCLHHLYLGFLRNNQKQLVKDPRVEKSDYGKIEG